MSFAKTPAPTPEQTKLLVAWLNKGALPETAAARIGVPVSVFRSWLTKGAKAGDSPEQRVYRDFAEAIDSALVEFQCKLLDIISDSAFTKQNVAAAQWLYMQRFGKKEQAELEARAKAELAGEDFNVRKEYSPEEIAAAEARALAAAANPPPVPERKPKMNFGLEDPREKKIH